jgi:hypothetical protein
LRTGEAECLHRKHTSSHHRCSPFFERGCPSFHLLRNHPSPSLRSPPTPHTAMKKLRIVTVGFRVGDRSRGRFATPADFPLHDCTPCRELHERRNSVYVVPRSRAIFCLTVPDPNRPIRNFCVAVQRCLRRQLPRGQGGAGGTHMPSTLVPSARVSSPRPNCPSLRQPPTYL